MARFTRGAMRPGVAAVPERLGIQDGISLILGHDPASYVPAIASRRQHPFVAFDTASAATHAAAAATAAAAAAAAAAVAATHAAGTTAPADGTDDLDESIDFDLPLGRRRATYGAGA